MNSPTRQFPSIIIGGVSANTPTHTPATSTPSICPLSTWNASRTRHRSKSAGAAKSAAVQGQVTLQLQFSK
jgi:hypothetical protein